MKQMGAVIAGQRTVLVSHDTLVIDAVQQMTDHRIGAVPVSDGDRVVGVFSERDVMGRVVASGRNPATTRVAEVMTTDLVVASPTDTYEEGLRLMQRTSVRHLLVLQDGRLAGIVSVRDLLRVDADEKQEAIALLNAYVHDIPLALTPGS